MKNKLKSSRTVGLFATAQIWLVGLRDGKAGLPKQAPDGSWFSPYMERYNKAYTQRAEEAFLECARLTAELQVKAEASALEIIRHEALREQLSVELAVSAAPEEALSARYPGEENLPESGVRARRKREHDALFAGKRTELAASNDFLKTAYSELSALKAKIAETETDVRLRVERIRANVDERILIYYHAALKVHPLKKEMPPCPRLTVTNAEATYLGSRNAEIDRIRSMQRIREAVQNGVVEYEAV